jgi:hypothetical protein
VHFQEDAGKMTGLMLSLTVWSAPSPEMAEPGLARVHCGQLTCNDPGCNFKLNFHWPRRTNGVVNHFITQAFTGTLVIKRIQ